MPSQPDLPGKPTPLRAAGHWRLRLLGGMQARNGDVLVTRFVSRPAAALLARLALWPQRMHAREELVGLLWPDADLDVGRNRLRQSLAALKRLLDLPGSDGAPVLLADRLSVRANPLALSCDVAEFERCVQQGRHDEARALYQGELLPGFYDEWVLEERNRLASLAERLGPAPMLSAQARRTAPSDAAADGANHDAAHGQGHASDDAQAPRQGPAVQGVSSAPASLQSLALPPIQAPQAPAYLTRMFGRQAALAQLREQVGRERLVTLSGPGGCGKTRLATELLRAPPLAQGFIFDLLAFVPLADCNDEAQMSSQVRASLQLPPPTRDPADPVVTALAGRRALLVLDNFEQLVNAPALALLERWLAVLPGLHLLVTSRRVLGLAGECEQVLPTLPLPDQADDAKRLLANPAVALFIDRARSVRPDFQVPVRQHEALAALCHALDGLPLAIEMAAARCRVFSIPEMHSALAQRFELLTRTGPAARGRRHDSLQAAIDWSWRLLSSEQQEALAALSVFRGGWTVADAEAVCELSDARRLLEGLVADSLVTRHAEPDETGEPATLAGAALASAALPAAAPALRFDMLESIRAFVMAHLPVDRAMRLRRAHRAHLLAQALSCQACGDGLLPQAQRPNAAEAMRTAVADGEPELALTLALALRGVWDSVGLASELLGLLDSALAELPADAPVGAPAAAMLALQHLTAGHGAEARQRAAQALERAAPDSAARAQALCARVRIAFELDRHTVGLQALLDDAEAMAVRIGAATVEAEVMGLRGMLALRHGQDPAAAERLLQRAADHHLALGQPREAWRLRYERACCMAMQGRRQQGLAEAAACETAFEATGDRHHRLGAINLQGVLYSQRREWALALRAYRRCAADAWHCRNHFWLAYALWNHGRNLARLRQPQLAARLMAFSEQHWTRHFGALDPGDQRFVRVVRQLVRHQLGAAQADAEWLQGQRLSLPQAVALALSLPDAPPA